MKATATKKNSAKRALTAILAAAAMSAAMIPVCAYACSGLQNSLIKTSVVQNTKHPGECGYNYVNEFGKHPGEAGFCYNAQ